jgi:adenylate cyclase
MLRNKKQAKYIIILGIGLFIASLVFLSGFNLLWNKWDFQAIDHLYSRLVKFGKGPKPSPRIIYLDITDKTYEKFNINELDRKILAQVNAALHQLRPEAVFYDMIFSRPGQAKANKEFSDSIKSLNKAYIPTTFSLSEQPKPFRWEADIGHDNLRKIIEEVPVERGVSHPHYGTRAIMSIDEISSATSRTGHINVIQDSDGTYRHHPLLIKLDAGFIPSITLAMFLDFKGLSMKDISIDWGEEMRISATSEGLLNEDLIVPIDHHGATFIPTVREWGKDFKRFNLLDFLSNFEDLNIRGNLEQIFESSFVIIVDNSQHSDTGKTSLQKSSPRVAIHASVLNSLLTRKFFSEEKFVNVFLILIALSFLLIISALVNGMNVLYLTGVLALAFIPYWGWYQLENNILFPIVSSAGGIGFVFSGLVVCIQILTVKERTFIKDAFSKYIPQKVVRQILKNPEILKLGGEERVMSVLFSDIAGFTTISEKMTPTELVGLLNEYLTAMTNIVLEEGGIIDKFEGDAVMAEFGAPLPTTEHADQAVLTGIKMQRRLTELRKEWLSRGLPKIEARVGINTGSMVIGNMGSDQVFDYTVMGDAVNLASRLEGANKPYGTFLMISEYTLEHLTTDRFRLRLLDVIRVKGKSESVKVYEVYGEFTDEIDLKDLKYYQSYEDGFKDYLNQEFSSATKLFHNCLTLKPDDLASKLMVDRIDMLDKKNLSSDWDGSVALTSK